jgi:hypothetical protein
VTTVRVDPTDPVRWIASNSRLYSDRSRTTAKLHLAHVIEQLLFHAIATVEATAYAINR